MAKIIAVDAGFANVGVAVLEHRRFSLTEGGTTFKWWPVDMAVYQTERCDKKIGLRQADDNARRIAEAVRGIKGMILKHEIRSMVAELPDTGGQNANAVRGMAYAASMLVTLAEAMDLAPEWYTQQQTRAAAGVPKAITGRDNVKKIVMAEMCRRYPELEATFPTLGRREHAADALATFEAARNGNLVRLMEAR